MYNQAQCQYNYSEMEVPANLFYPSLYKLNEQPVIEDRTIDPISDLISSLASQNFDSLSAPEFNRVIQLLHILNSSKIDLMRLRRLSCQGIPPGCIGLRSIVWRVLLGHLPPNAEEWEAQMALYKQQYDGFKKDYVVIPTAESTSEGEGKARTPEAQTSTSTSRVIATHKLPAATDHPLSTEKDSHWHEFFKDKQQTETIMNDVVRTRADICFFLMDAISGSKGSSKENHGDVMGRMLLIYTKLNPGVRYVQGMNEILAIIYISSVQDLLPKCEEYVESESFFTFSRLMGEIRDNFIRSLDQTAFGVRGRLDSIAEILKRVRFPVWDKLRKLAVEYEYFALRWVLLLLAQDFSVGDTQLLWDIMFSDPNRFQFLLYLIVGLILNVEKDILKGEFSIAVQALQGSPKTISARKLIEQAQQIYMQDQKALKH